MPRPIMEGTLANMPAASAANAGLFYYVETSEGMATLYQSDGSDWILLAGPGQQGATGDTGPTGPAGLTWKGPWSDATAYAVGDAVSDGTLASSYICTVAHTNHEPPDTDYWDILAQCGASAPS